MLDFAVDIRAVEPPSWLLERLTARLGDLRRYPGESDRRCAIHAVATSLAGGAENIAVSRCDTFVGHDGQASRAAVRPEWPTPVEALIEAATGKALR